MRRGQVVALHVIVDVDLPVAGDFVIAARGEMQLAGAAADFSRFPWNLAEHLGQRRRLRVLIHKDERPPRLHPKLRQADLRALPDLDAFEFGLAVQTAVQRVGPRMVRAANHRRRAMAISQQRTAMAAHVGKGPQRALLVARHQDRLAGNLACQVTAGGSHGVRPAHHLPRAAKDIPGFQRQHGGVSVPVGRNGGCPRQVRLEGEIAQVQGSMLS